MFHRQWLCYCLCISTLGVVSVSLAFAEATLDGQGCVSQLARADSESQRVARDSRAFKGSIAWVADGDSIWIRVDDREIEVRLAGIDAPERDQPYGWESKLGLVDLVRGREVKLIPRDVDRHGRIVAQVWVDDIDASRELVRRGLAWFYPAFSQDPVLRCEERRAKQHQRGMWALPSPQAPWVRRREMDRLERKWGSAR